MKFNQKPNRVLYVSSLPGNFSDNELYSLFSQYGIVVSAKMQTSQDPTKNSSYGFVTFQTLDSAVFALQQLDGFVINNYPIKVSFKRQSTTKSSH